MAVPAGGGHCALLEHVGGDQRPSSDGPPLLLCLLRFFFSLLSTLQLLSSTHSTLDVLLGAFPSAAELWRLACRRRIRELALTAAAVELEELFSQQPSHRLSHTWAVGPLRNVRRLLRHPSPGPTTGAASRSRRSRCRARAGAASPLLRSMTPRSDYAWHPP